MVQEAQGAVIYWFVPIFYDAFGDALNIFGRHVFPITWDKGDFLFNRLSNGRILKDETEIVNFERKDTLQVVVDLFGNFNFIGMLSHVEYHTGTVFAAQFRYRFPCLMVNGGNPGL